MLPSSRALPLRRLFLSCLTLVPRAASASTLAPFPALDPLRAPPPRFADAVFALPRLHPPDASTEIAVGIFPPTALAHVVLLMLYALCLVTLMPGLGRRIARAKG